MAWDHSSQHFFMLELVLSFYLHLEELQFSREVDVLVLYYTSSIRKHLLHNLERKVRLFVEKLAFLEVWSVEIVLFSIDCDDLNVVTMIITNAVSDESTKVDLKHFASFYVFLI